MFCRAEGICKEQASNLNRKKKKRFWCFGNTSCHGRKLMFKLLSENLVKNPGCEVSCRFIQLWPHSMNSFRVLSNTKRKYAGGLKPPDWSRFTHVWRKAVLCLCEQFVPIPDIRHCCEDAIFQWLWRHPANWQQAFSSFSIVIRLINISGHAKIWRKKNPKQTGWGSH